MSADRARALRGGHRRAWPCLVAALLCSAPAAASQEESDRFVAQAMRIAGDDLRAEAVALCPRPPEPPSPGYHDQVHLLIPPVQVFDDMQYVGNEGVGVTILPTSEGLVLIDSMTTDREVEEVLLPGLAALGHDPADIAYIIVTHGHGDHHGGIQALRRINPSIRVIMSETDWAFAAKPLYMRDGTPDPAPRPERKAQDIGFGGTFRLTLGDRWVDLVETPGHTPGTASLLYPVHYNGQQLMVMQWGGGNPTQAAYDDRVVRSFIDRALQAGARVRWSSHAQAEDLPKLAMLRADAETRPATHPFIYSTGQFRRWTEMMYACKAAKAAADSGD